MKFTSYRELSMSHLASKAKGENMKQTTVLSTINALLQDQKFLLALITVLSIVAVQLVPTLTPKADMITNVLIALGGILVLHQGVEDLKGDKDALPIDFQTAVIQLVTELFGLKLLQKQSS